MICSRLLRPLLALALLGAVTACGDDHAAQAAATPVVATPTATPAEHTSAVQGSTRYVFPLTCRDVRYSSSHHDYPAADMFAPVGCPFVSPVDGIVDEVSATDSWNPTKNTGASRGGLSVSVVGTDGVRYYGSHLSAIAKGIRPGLHVRAGQLLGKVGHSGDARYISSHLHFGISWPTRSQVWWVRRGEVYPQPYLNSWRAGGQKSPAVAVAQRHRAVGDRGCTVDC